MTDATFASLRKGSHVLITGDGVRAVATVMWRNPEREICVEWPASSARMTAVVHDDGRVTNVDVTFGLDADGNDDPATRVRLTATPYPNSQDVWPVAGITEAGMWGRTRSGSWVLQSNGVVDVGTASPYDAGYHIASPRDAHAAMDAATNRTTTERTRQRDILEAHANAAEKAWNATCDNVCDAQDALRRAVDVHTAAEVEARRARAALVAFAADIAPTPLTTAQRSELLRYFTSRMESVLRNVVDMFDRSNIEPWMRANGWTASEHATCGIVTFYRDGRDTGILIDWTSHAADEHIPAHVVTKILPAIHGLAPEEIMLGMCDKSAVAREIMTQFGVLSRGV